MNTRQPEDLLSFLHSLIGFQQRFPDEAACAEIPATTPLYAGV
jgi:hypothetical protein